MRRDNCSSRLNFDFLGIVIIGLFFFVICYNGFWWTDDIDSQHNGIYSLSDLVNRTRITYFEWSGLWLVKFFQNLFCVMLQDQRWCFDVANTVLFLAHLLICGKLVTIHTKEWSLFFPFVFALLFWFLCPIPRETLFWAVGSIGYMWTNVLVFAFLYLFLKYKDADSSFVCKIGIFLFSLVSASNVIPSVSICGAFVVYYCTHIKQLKGNAIPFVAGFVIGTLIILFAPGNFVRAAKFDNYFSFFDKFKIVLFHPIREFVKYKAFWLLVLALIFGFIKGGERVVNSWLKDNAILVYTLGWSIIAFSVVFQPDVRALTFTEALSIVLMMKFVLDTWESLNWEGYWIFKKMMLLKMVLLLLLIVDAYFAVKETKLQRNNNENLLTQIADANGVIALDTPISRHRMAYVPFFPDWTWESLANKMNLDSVHVYPYFCQDKYFTNSLLGNNVFVDQEGRMGEDGMVIIRMPSGTKNMAGVKGRLFSITYLRPKKWYRLWLDKLRDYQYERTVEVHMETPNVHYDGYDYYLVWLKKENARNVKSVSIID